MSISRLLLIVRHGERQDKIYSNENTELPYCKNHENTGSIHKYSHSVPGRFDTPICTKMRRLVAMGRVQYIQKGTPPFDERELLTKTRSFLG